MSFSVMVLVISQCLPVRNLLLGSMHRRTREQSSVPGSESHRHRSDLVEVVVDLALHLAGSVVAADERAQQIGRLGAVVALVVEGSVRGPGRQTTRDDHEMRP